MMGTARRGPGPNDLKNLSIAAIRSVGNQDAAFGIPADQHIVVPTAPEGLLAQFLDDEHVIADPYLILNAGTEHIFVVEAALETVVGLAGTAHKTQGFGRTTR